MGPELVFYLFSLFIFLIFSFFFSISETSYTACTYGKIYKLKSEKHPKAKKLLHLIEKRHEIVPIILTLNNIVNIASSSISTVIFVEYLGDGLGLQISVILMTFIIVIFCEILPKHIAVRYPDKILILTADIYHILHTVCMPIFNAWYRVSKRKNKPHNHKNTESDPDATSTLKGEIEFWHNTGSVQKQDKDMLSGILELDDVDVSEIMTPKKDVEMFDIEENIEEIIKYTLSSGHSRIPIYREKQDDIIGILHAVDLLSLLYNKKDTITKAELEKIMFKPIFVSENTKLKNQLKEFRKKHNHLSIVVDEYGNMVGVISLEDILEEIVGNIEDEHDERRNKSLLIKNDGTIIARGDYQIRDFNRELSTDFNSEDASSIAGLVIEHAERIPDEKEVFLIGGYNFEILKKDLNKITLMKIYKEQTAQ